jgi:hypothetical protein
MAGCAWCTKPKPRLALRWKQVEGIWFCPEHQQKHQISRVVERATTCVYCGGPRPKGDASEGWQERDRFWYCPGCWTIEAGDPAGLSECARSDFAAARLLLRACDEIDDRYRRLSHDAAAEESEPWRRTITDVGQALDEIGGEPAMRRALLLVSADADPDHLVTPMAGGTAMDPARKTAVTSHVHYIEREWSGIGHWQG